MDISEITAIAGNLSPFVLALIAIIAYQRGWVVSQSVVTSIVADTVKIVLEGVQTDNEKVIVDISARIIGAMDELLKDHEGRLFRELDRKPPIIVNGVKHL